MPQLCAGFHGGICRVCVMYLMSAARTCASENVISENGPISPGWWQVWQFAWKMRTTSLLKVGPAGAGGGFAARWRDAPRAANAKAATTTILRLLPMLTSQLAAAANDFIHPRPASCPQLPRVNLANVHPCLHLVKKGS